MLLITYQTLKKETSIHVAQGVWALEGFEEVLVTRVTCNIQQCKNGYYKGRNKNFSKIYVLGM